MGLRGSSLLPVGLRGSSPGHLFIFAPGTFPEAGVGGVQERGTRLRGSPLKELLLG